MIYRYSLSIAQIGLLIETDHPVDSTARFEQFLDDIAVPDFTARFRRVSSLPHIPAQVLFEGNGYRVHPDGKGGYMRSFLEELSDPTPYAVATWEQSCEVVQIDYLEKGAHCVSEMHNSFFHLGFEAMLIHRQRLCLHASCVHTPMGGILFSGRSGVGKSTQAELWCKYRNARQINGDRPILSKGDNRWQAWGSPYAGSSHCYVNESCPVTAIMILRQAEKCTLRRLSIPEAFRAVWSGLTMYSWDQKFVEEACNLTMDLIGTVPVYEFGCTPDAEAVDYLEQALRKECGL